MPEGLQAFAHKEGLESEWADVMEIVAGHLRERKARARRPGQDHGTGFGTSFGTGFGANSGAFGTGFGTNFGTDLGVDTRPKIFEDRPTFGRPWVRSPLSHAPTNKMGVVFLFGAMALDLGFVVSRLQMGYPDCEAMREVAPRIWQRVRIELEYESRNFLTHMHAPGGCDMIVCWRHNWPECPMEVVELEKYCGKWMM